MMSSAIKSFGQAFLKSLRSREAEPFVARRNGRNPPMLQKAQDGFRKPSPGEDSPTVWERCHEVTERDGAVSS